MDLDDEVTSDNPGTDSPYDDTDAGIQLTIWPEKKINSCCMPFAVALGELTDSNKLHEVKSELGTSGIAVLPSFVVYA